MARRLMLLVALPVLALAAALVVGCQRSGDEASVDAEVIGVGDTTPAAEAEEEAGAATPEASGEGVDSEEGASGSSTSDSDAAASAPAVADSDEWVAPLPEDLSTGPLLEWQEIDPAGPDLGFYVLQSTSDGRVVAWSHIADVTDGGGYAYVTGNGTHWDTVRLPTGIRPSALAVSGDRWGVVGWPVSDNVADGSSMLGLGLGAQAFLSDNQGATWTDLQLHSREADRPVPEFAAAAYSPTTIVMDDGTVVVAAIYGVFLDVPALLADRGLLPSGERVADWWVEDDALQVFFSDDWDESDLSVPLADLGLTPDQRELVDPYATGPESEVVVFAGDGAALTQAPSYDLGMTGAVMSADGDSGFALVLFSGDGISLLTSSDGYLWEPSRSITVDWSLGVTLPVLADGVIWEAASQADGVVISSGRIGEPAREIARLPGLQALRHLDAGAAGLAAGVALVPPVTSAAGASGPEALMPAGSVAKDGYELRLDEPEGGMTLWDLVSDEAVYVFGPEILESDDPPDGVRQEGQGDEYEVAFDDPETGELLVVFTAEDLTPLVELMMEADIQNIADDWPEMWVGWAADGSAWGWQTAADAFGIDGLPNITGLAVGADFVTAIVQDLDPVRGTNLAAEAERVDPTNWESVRTRWYVARTP